MGWAFEYLGAGLRDDVVDRLEKVGVKHDQWNHLGFDEETRALTNDGNDYPECGEFEGEVRVEDCIGEIVGKVKITYVIKRAMPDNGLDYGDYESEYECVLKKFKFQKERGRKGLTPEKELEKLMNIPTDQLSHILNMSYEAAELLKRRSGNATQTQRSKKD